MSFYSSSRDASEGFRARLNRLAISWSNMGQAATNMATKLDCDTSTTDEGLIPQLHKGLTEISLK